MPPDPNSLASLAFQIREQTPGTEEREALLERIAAEVRAGKYRVNADELAAKLLQQLAEPDASEAASERDSETKG